MILAYDDESKEIVIVKRGSNDDSYEDFLSNFPSDDCRYALRHFDYETNNGKRSKLVLYYWCPKDSKGKNKMIYACTISSLKNALNGIQLTVDGGSISDFEVEDVKNRCMKFR